MTDKIIVYPNPIRGQDFKIFGAIENSEILIYSLNGTLIKTLFTNNENEFSIKTNHLAKGVYILKIKKTSSQEIKTVKVEVF